MYPPCMFVEGFDKCSPEAILFNVVKEDSPEFVMFLCGISSGDAFVRFMDAGSRKLYLSDASDSTVRRGDYVVRPVLLGNIKPGFYKITEEQFNKSLHRIEYPLLFDLSEADANV